MAIPRKYLVDDSVPCADHSLLRCVRLAYLCGDVPLTGTNCDHRKDWLEKRLLELAAIFSVVYDESKATYRVYLDC